MISEFIKILKRLEVKEFIGIPDSVLASLMSEIDKDPYFKVSIPSNEGSSISEYFGKYLAKEKNKRVMIFAQNAGLGNMVNPLTSLIDDHVYQVPIVLVIGLRGSDKDEPQHSSMGMITRPLLKLLGFELCELNENSDVGKIFDVIDRAYSGKGRLALIISRNTFKTLNLNYAEGANVLRRKDVISSYMQHFGDKCWYFGSTGMIGRELYEIAQLHNLENKVLISPGSMGHFTSIIKGFKSERPDIPTIAFEGDGSILMHLGNFVDLIESKPQNHLHVILNNGSHASVGGIRTFLQTKSLLNLLKYSPQYRIFKSSYDLDVNFQNLSELQGSLYHEIHISLGNENEIGRPTTSYSEQLLNFQSLIL